MFVVILVCYLVRSLNYDYSVISKLWDSPGKMGHGVKGPSGEG